MVYDTICLLGLLYARHDKEPGSGKLIGFCVIDHIYIYITTQENAAKALREKWGDDPDAVFLPEGGVKFIGPRGREETEAEHLARLGHNSRMRFNRSFAGWGCANFTIVFDKYYTGFV